MEKQLFRSIATAPAEEHIHCTRIEAGNLYRIKRTRTEGWVSVTGKLIDKDGGAERHIEKHLPTERVLPFFRQNEIAHLQTASK